MKYDFQKRSDDSAIHFDPKDNPTRQEFVSQCHINTIVKRYSKNGINPHCITQDARYGDFTNVPSHQEALDLVLAAEEHFMQFPAHIRARFNNDPGQMLDFLANIDNRAEAIDLGLILDDQKLDSFDKNKSPAKPDVNSSEGASKA